MQGLLSFEQAPPISAPLRFFLTAPVFAIFAGLLLVWSGPELFSSRWTPAALALTHLVTVGFMLQAMLGALMQLLPVMAGANLQRPLLIARVVHAAITSGTICLIAAFLTYRTVLFACAMLFLGGGVTIFIAAAGHALFKVTTNSPTVRGLKLALIGLGTTVGLGLLLAAALGWSLPLPLVQLANIHLGWGLAAWSCVVLASVAHVAVPMFQLTPDYPAWFARSVAWALLAVISLWTIADLAGLAVASAMLATIVVLSAACFAVLTLKIQRQSKRPSFDTVQMLWRVAMLSSLVACSLWLLAQFVPALGETLVWPLLFGALLLYGGFMSIIVGMLYKIVPFLVWLHLQNLGRGRMPAPNMKKVLDEKQMRRQMNAHFVSLATIVLAVLWPDWFIYPAGFALVVANGWLLRNLLSATAVYRTHSAKISALTAGQADR